MPIIYLSPSTQENNLYVNGGTEEQWMNRLADALEPYLTASGIRYSRNTPDMTAASSIRASNAGDYDLHLALHSNAAPEGRYGTVRGILVYYYPGSTQGKRAAELVADNLKTIYPLPNKVRAESTTAIGEVRRVRAPSVFIELGYHDNPDDAAWIQSNLDAAARSIALALTAGRRKES
jgi:N-acetylmuramoyl-L-alanine amidase